MSRELIEDFVDEFTTRQLEHHRPLIDRETLVDALEEFLLAECWQENEDLERIDLALKSLGRVLSDDQSASVLLREVEREVEQLQAKLKRKDHTALIRHQHLVMLSEQVRQLREQVQAIECSER